jgi:hypothetical protein
LLVNIPSACQLKSKIVLGVTLCKLLSIGVIQKISVNIRCDTKNYIIIRCDILNGDTNITLLEN